MVQAATKLEELPDNYDKPSAKVISDLKEITDNPENYSDTASDAENEKKVGPAVTRSIIGLVSKECKNALLVFAITMITTNPLFHRSFFNIPFISSYSEPGLINSVILGIAAMILFVIAKFFV
jgi:hypothetical protein